VGVALLSAAGSDLAVHRATGRIPDLVAVMPPDAGERRPIGIGHLAREVAYRLGNEVDRPRNLAKSVTVE
jgi:glucosamine 6-phosphate synthetase-like amidotransferase/phosphosugar isomerase protein